MTLTTYFVAPRRHELGQSTELNSICSRRQRCKDEGESICHIVIFNFSIVKIHFKKLSLYAKTAALLNPPLYW